MTAWLAAAVALWLYVALRTRGGAHPVPGPIGVSLILWRRHRAAVERRASEQPEPSDQADDGPAPGGRVRAVRHRLAELVLGEPIHLDVPIDDDPAPAGRTARQRVEAAIGRQVVQVEDNAWRVLDL